VKIVKKNLPAFVSCKCKLQVTGFKFQGKPGASPPVTWNMEPVTGTSNPVKKPRTKN
jgi:hypothetical protein